MTKLLRAELDDLPSLDGFGLEAFDFDALLKPGRGGLTDPDDVPPQPKAATSKRGDVWTLGGHRLMCGDATDTGDVGRLLDGAIRGRSTRASSSNASAAKARKPGDWSPSTSGHLGRAGGGI